MNNLATFESPSMTQFRDNIKVLIEDGAITISEIARRADLSRSGVSRMLSGEWACTIPNADKIAEAVGISLAELITAPVHTSKKM